LGFSTLTVAKMLHDYDFLCRQLTSSGDRQSVVDYLDAVLPAMWQEDYLAMPFSSPNILVVTSGDDKRVGAFCRYMFDHASDASNQKSGLINPAQYAEDRVVAAWGTSRREPARTRDAARMRGFLRGVWAQRFGGADRGHFFAHTMGGGLDINLFPQAKRVNRGGLWRKMESFCALNPGTFCFVRPIYADESWRPRQLEYGIFKIRSNAPVEFWGHVFEN
jgi:hypothetical protein